MTWKMIERGKRWRYLNSDGKILGFVRSDLPQPPPEALYIEAVRTAAYRPGAPDERERCAKIAEDPIAEEGHLTNPAFQDGFDFARQQIAAKIRSGE